MIWDSRRGFIKGKLCQPGGCLLWWSDCNVWQKKTNLKFFKAFDMVPLHILISKMERHILVRWTIWWVRTWLDGRSQWVAINGSVSRCRLVTGGAPWALSLGQCSLISLPTIQTERSSAHSAGLQVTQSWMVH